VKGWGVQLVPHCTTATNRPIVPAPDDYGDGEICGMIGRGKRSTRRKPAPVQLCPPQTPHVARAAAVESQRLKAWATARPTKNFFWGVLWGYWLCGHSWPTVPASGDSEDDCGEGWLWRRRWNVDWQGKPKFSDKTCPNATFIITKSHMTRPGFEPGPPRWEAGD
jgi:hypothetical protein